MYDFTPQGRLRRVQTWKDTLEHYKGKSVQSSEKTDHVPALDEFTELRIHPRTRIKIVGRDCIDVAQEYATAGHRVMLLNMADWRIAGGLVQGGVATQEEECFRRSDYHLHLLQSYYPLDTYDLIVSHQVEYYKASDAYQFAVLNTPFHVDMIASPALAHPETDAKCTRMTNDEDIDIMRNKIRQLIWCAAKNGNDVLVLSAWGCGAFGCPAQHIAQLFKEVIHETSGAVPTIVFAIFPAHPSLRGTDRDAHKIFVNIFNPPGNAVVPQ